MKAARSIVIIIGALAAVVSVAGGAAQAGKKNGTAKGAKTAQWSFDTDPVGKLPSGARVFGGIWAVRAEADAPSPAKALCQTGSEDYPALSLSDRTYGDVTMSTRFKPVSGSSDRAAGLIFRIQDRDNYYIVRANALEDNVNIYKYVKGRRSLISEGSARVLSGTWQELRVEVKGHTIRGFLNGRLVVEGSDDTFGAGKVGLWTKADSVTCFDDVRVE